MDNDFKRQTPRPFGQPARPMQPMKPMQPRHMQPMSRPISAVPIAQHPSSQPMHTPIAPQAINQQHTQQLQNPTHSIQNQSLDHTSFQNTHSQTPDVPINTPHDTKSSNDHQFSSPKPKNHRQFKKSLKLVSVIIIVIILGFGAWSYFNTTQQKLDEQAVQIETLITQLNATKKTNQALIEQIENTPGATVGLTQEEINSVTSAVTSGNYAAIQKFLNDDTLVIIAASEGVGRRTPEQVVNDLKYLDSASQPWNFSLPEDTLDNYRDGDYAQYFPEGAIIGKSADNKVVSFSTTPSGKISVVFLASDESLL